MSLTQAVKDEARRLGFHLVGVTTPDPPPHFGVFQEWLASDRHGEMAYLATPRSLERREDPRRILPECRSILVLGIRYPSPNARLEEPPAEALQNTEPGGSEQALATGRVAAYAWGEDYHEALPERLQALVAFVERQVGRAVPNRWYTDSGPILERDLAQRAGLGWIGKNTCLINPRQGSYFLLAEVLLGIELEPDPPFLSDHCGNCTRCLEACPTGCILPNRTLDARRCISYLTIELKGAIPTELRLKTGDWIFGCDVCQGVCPWNLRFALLEGDPAFAPRRGVPRPRLADETRLDANTFNLKFKHSPLKRAKRRGYLRNVAVALGNVLAGRPASSPASAALARLLLENPEALVRGHAAWALGQSRDAEALRYLCQAEGREKDAGVLAEIRAARRQIEAALP